MSLPLLRGDCLTCSKIETCSITSIERVKNSFTCPLFTEVAEPVYWARIHMMQAYGEDSAIEAMLKRPPEPDDEDHSVDEEFEEGDEDDG